MNTLELKRHQLERRKTRVRKRIYGTAEKPRLTVSRSLQNIYAQLVDDDRGVTLCAASSRDKDLRGQIAYGGNKAAAAAVGKALAERAIAKGVSAICFDRNGRRYHGRIKVLADAAREGGLKF